MKSYTAVMIVGLTALALFLIAGKFSDQIIAYLPQITNCGESCSSLFSYGMLYLADFSWIAMFVYLLIVYRERNTVPRSTMLWSVLAVGFVLVGFVYIGLFTMVFFIPLVNDIINSIINGITFSLKAFLHLQ